ncbi:MAG: TIGR01777 family protein [Acidobacteria bacterium ACB1]|nr:Epimerase family protein [Pyrinomonadaceae bacterium]MCE7962256.1 TIGR01777 family protein [Acidobacteria bacterium ACB1]RIJ93724.1 MAG: TIGR01777 family protein [Acidobacteriota bacterium]
MRILITGASGLIGKALTKVFDDKGYELLLAGRSEPKDTRETKWTIEDGFAEPERLEGLDAVVHLAGESVSALRWSDEKKAAIRNSRVEGTRSVVDALSRLKARPKTFISGSAIGFYGDRDDEVLSESSVAGDNFLAQICREWESESRRAEDAGIRTVLLRTGIVLSKDGGALATMLLPFKMGVGGVVGSGKQWMSWISLPDEIRAIEFVLERDDIRGAVNLTSPNPVTNQQFTSVLGEALYRPTFIPLPEFAISMLFGEMGDELLLSSTRVEPKRLIDAGFTFEHADLKSAIENALAEPSA